MNLYRAAAVACVLSFSLVPYFAATTPSKAQGLTRYGMWGNNVKRRRSAPSKAYKFAPPPRLKIKPSKLGALAATRTPGYTKRRRPRKPIAVAQGGARPEIQAKAPKTVTFKSDVYNPGDVVIDTKRRRLFLLLAREGLALSYPIAVGKRGFTWTGVEQVTHVQDWPDWFPPEEMRERSPRLPLRMTGGLRNPLGAKAIYLGKTLYRIHGTNNRWSIGRATSSGCFRMHNAHVVHLAKFIDKKTTVHVLDRLPRGVVKDEKRKWKKKRVRSKRKYRTKYRKRRRS